MTFTFIDLFAGIGGIRLPFQELGGKCVFTSEWDKFSQKTYFANYGEVPHGDRTKIETKDIPSHDILLGGFPCQAFSIAGLRKGFNETRGTLFFEIQRIIEDKKPKIFLLENVKGLITHDKGNTFKTILDILKENYSVVYKVLKATDFGVPQNRQRIYIIGFNKEYFSEDIIDKFEWPKPIGVSTKVGDILESKVDIKYTMSDKMWNYLKERKELMKLKGDGWSVFTLVNKDTPYTNTITARYYKDGSEILVDQSDLGLNPRKLTPRECARLQGFPEEFIINAVSNSQMYKQFGNSVSVPVIRALANNIIKVIK